MLNNQGNKWLFQIDLQPEDKNTNFKPRQESIQNYILAFLYRKTNFNRIYYNIFHKKECRGW